MATPRLTTIKDTLYNADGSAYAGTVVIINTPFQTSEGIIIPGKQRSVTLSSGVLNTSLVPNTGTTPATTYTVRYYETTIRFYEETWAIPVTSPLVSPNVTSVSQTGTPGAVTYYYWASAVNDQGETLLGTSVSTATSHATLSGSNYNVIQWTPVTGATSYRIWRTTSSTRPSGTGAYLVGSTSSTTINDQSNTASSGTIPPTNDTDYITINHLKGYYQKRKSDDLNNWADAKTVTLLP
jgi:hypothetical protein